MADGSGATMLAGPVISRRRMSLSTITSLSGLGSLRRGWFPPPTMTGPTSSSDTFTVEKTSANVHVIRCYMDSCENWEQWVLLRSDAHHDSRHCRRDIEKRHLDEAVKRNAIILDFGDIFDVMQGPGDKRSSLSDLREELKRGDYFNSVVEDAASFYGPYAKNIAVLGYGNHETAVTKKYGIDLLANLTTLLNYQNGTRVSTGGYTGYVRFQFIRKTNRLTARVLKYDHGSGGGGAVTAGVIQAQRRAVFVSNADFVCTGHVHEQWMRVIMKEELSVGDKVVTRPQYHLCTPGYKDEYRAGEGGWHVERGAPPKPLGAIWIRFTFKGDQLQEEITLAA